MERPLSPRERENTALVATGATNREIAQQLGISPRTVRNLLMRVFAKTGVRTRTALAVRVVQADSSPDESSSLI